MKTIRRYDNRKLYDLEAKGYIGQHEILDLIARDEPFQVIDMKTKTDVTRSVLLHMLPVYVKLNEVELINLLKKGRS